VTLRVAFMNITENKCAEEALRESEEKYRNLFHRSKDAIFIHDLDGTIIDANQSALKLFGYTKPEMTAIKISQLHPAETLEKSRRAFETIIQEDVITFEIAFQKKNGDVFPAEVSSSLFEIGGKQVIQGIARDITNRKQAEKEKRRLQRQLLKAQKIESIGILAGGIAHDYNNLLSVIIGNIELAKEICQPKTEIYRLMKGAEKASFQAQELTKRLITFSKGGAPIKKRGSIETLVIDITNHIFSGYNIGVEFSFPTDLWDVDFDENQMKHALKNLLANALEALPENGSITISAENVEIDSRTSEFSLALLDGQYVKTTIRDNGIGIPEEHLSNIFDPYFSTKEKGIQKGLGLGLTTTYSIVTRHDGYIFVESEVGVGTTFTILLPTGEHEISGPERSQKPRLKKTAIHSRKVLLMDDEKMIRDIGRQILKKYDYDAAVAVHGDEAVEMYQKAMTAGEPFAIVILDLSVKGGMGGKEALKNILAINPQARVVVSSGYSNDPVMTHFKEYGFTAAIAKPYTPKDLNEILNTILEKDHTE
jgi:PAS domain S-box-containing protein